MKRRRPIDQKTSRLVDGQTCRGGRAFISWSLPKDWIPVPSTSAQIPQWLHRRLSAYLARAQAEDRDDSPTRFGFTSAALLAMPADAMKLVRLWEEAAEPLVLKRRTNPGVKRSIQLTDEAHRHLLDVYACCVENGTELQKQHIISLAIYGALREKGVL